MKKNKKLIQSSKIYNPCCGVDKLVRYLFKELSNNFFNLNNYIKFIENILKISII
jgi:hypothetical protein